jgi:hypothetical protein
MTDAEKAQMLIEYDRESLGLITEKNKQIREAAQTMAASKAQYTEDKHAWDRLNTELNALIDERQEHRGKPRQATLVDGLDPNKPASGVPKDLWRQYPLDRWTEFGLTAGEIAKLAANSPPISTVGELSDFLAPHPSNPEWSKKITDVPGIGKGKGQKIEDANQAFWKWYQTKGGAEEYAKELGLLKEDAGDAGQEQSLSEPSGSLPADVGGPEQGAAEAGLEGGADTVAAGSAVAG